MSAQSNVGYLLHHISAVLARTSDQILQEQLGIGFSQFKILLTLEQDSAVSQKDIAVTLGQTEASVSRQIKLLHDEGLLTSQPNPNNRRQHNTRLTPKGSRFLAKSTEILNRYHAPLFERLTERQQHDLRELLTSVHQAVCPTPDH